MLKEMMEMEMLQRIQLRNVLVSELVCISISIDIVILLKSQYV